MSKRPTAPATLPPETITGLDPAWSRLVSAPAAEDVDRTWHLLDSWAERSKSESVQPSVTLLCVHGNPSWSFVWRTLLASAPEHVRVIAVDQLDMGYSERTGVKRTLATRIEDLCRLTQVLVLSGPVITVAHDWGGPISLGWAQRHRRNHTQEPAETSGAQTPDSESLDEATSAFNTQSEAYLRAVVLTNTAVHQPESLKAPSVIRLINTAATRSLLTVRTRAFIHGAVKMSKPALSSDVSDGFHAPYGNADRRLAIADFVADIPLHDSHESASVLDDIAERLKSFDDIPALLLWGPRDKVFSDVYLTDLEQRLPHAQVHRYPNAAHFVMEDVDVAGAVFDWLVSIEGETADFTSAITSNDAPSVAPVPPSPLVPTLAPTLTPSPTIARAMADFSLAEGAAPAVVEPAPSNRQISFAELEQRVNALAAGLLAFGISPGQKVAVMIMPGIDLSVVVYACWRAGITLVLVDSGLGRQGMQRALQSARPHYLIGIDKALLAASVLRWPGIRIAVAARSSLIQRSLQIVTDLEALSTLGQDTLAKNQIGAPSLAPAPALIPWPGPGDIAVIAFTSGSTGPSKGVLYTHQQLQAQRDALMSLYDISTHDRLVAAFAPFALHGPTMGITSTVPDMDVTQPASLSAQRLMDSIRQVDATLVFASPAALVNVVATQSSRQPATPQSVENGGDKDTEKSTEKSTDEATVKSTKISTDAMGVRVVLSAGAPVRATLLESVGQLFPNAQLHTPYGMTEVLPVSNVSLAELRDLNAELSPQDHTRNGDAGVCVGFVSPGVIVCIDPLDASGKPTGQLTQEPRILGEIIVQAAHSREGYVRLWHTQYQASLPAGEGVHRSADVGQLDEAGRLWIGGRLGHVILSANGPIAPVAGEQKIETLGEVAMASLVGVGPAGTQLVVAVLQMENAPAKHGAAPLELADQVRRIVGDSLDIASVLIAERLPVDKRHNSKIDRAAIADWAAKVLAGDKVRSL